MQEEVKQVTTEEVTKQGEETPADTKAEAEVEENKESKKYFKSFVKEDDWKLYESNLKEKYTKEVYSSLGVADKKAFNDLVEGKTKELDELKKKYTKLESDFNSVNENSLLDQYGVVDESRDDVLILAKAKVQKGDYKTLDEAIKGIVEKNKYLANKPTVKKFNVDTNPEETKNSKPSYNEKW